MRLSPGAHVLVKGPFKGGKGANGGVRGALVLTLEAQRAEVAYEPCADAAGRVRVDGGDVREQLAALQRLAAAIEEEGAAPEAEVGAGEEEEEAGEEEKVHFDRLICVHTDLAALQMALLLNMARCNLAQKARHPCTHRASSTPAL